MTITHLAKTLSIASLLLAITACSTAPRTETAQTRSVDAILADIETAAYPAFDPTRRSDEDYVAAYIAEREGVAEQRAELILELYEADANHERVPALMAERWQASPNDAQRTAQMRLEIDEAVARHGADTPLGSQARFSKVNFAMTDLFMNSGDPDDTLAAIEKFIAEAPDDPRAASLLFQVAAYGYEGGSVNQVGLLERVRDTYTDSEDPRAAQSARSAAGQLRQLAAIGETFDIAFTCAVTGSEVETATLAGKVVVIDFWATWCGPCVAKMPEMKVLYDKYRDQGVEFIGISLDQPVENGGLEKLLAFVEENDLKWPQWYQGKGWQSEFSTEWGISGIPTLFIVDAEGRLRSTTARSKLEELIVELIAERDADMTQRSSL